MPDRIKLITQFVVFSLFTWVMLLLPMAFVVDVFILKAKQGDKTSLLPVIIPLTLLTLFIQGWRFIYKWRQLLREEAAGNLPDMGDPRNIKPFQMWLIFIGIVLLVTSYTVSQLYSSFAGGVCFLGVLILGGAERYIIRKQEKKAQHSAADGLR